MEEKREDGISANRGSSRGACILYFSFWGFVSSDVVMWSPGERHRHRKGKHCGCRGRGLLALGRCQQIHYF